GGVSGGAITLSTAANPVVQISSGSTIMANGGTGSGGTILFQLASPGTAPLKVVNAGTVSATNTADNTGIIGLNGSGQAIRVHEGRHGTTGHPTRGPKGELGQDEPTSPVPFPPNPCRHHIFHSIIRR